MDVAMAFFGDRLVIKEGDGPIVFLSCSNDLYFDICDEYEKRGFTIQFCDSVIEIEKIRSMSWDLS